MLRNYQATILPVVVILLVALLGVGGLVVDLSQGYLVQTKIKNAVDLATLAGISQLNGPETVNNVKNTTLQYLNNNLTMTIPSFQSLTLSSEGLSIQIGVYNSTNMTFTVDELNPDANAIMISYRHNSMTFFAPVLMIDNILVADDSTVAKQPAGRMRPGSGFPLVVYNTALNDARTNNNMLNLYSAGDMDNSFWTDYTAENPSTTDIRNVLDYFQTGMGTVPPGVSVEDSFRVNDGGMGGIFMSMNPNVLLGMTYLLAVVTPLEHYADSKLVKADGFVAATINNIVDSMGQKYIDITIQPGYIDNTFGGLQIGNGVVNVDSNNRPLLSNSFGLVQ